MNKIKVVAITLMTALCGVTAMTQPAAAINVFGGCNGNSDTRVCRGQNDSAASLVNVIINAMFFLIGSIAVLMIVIGATRYVTSNGDPGAVKAAKDTVMYAVIGLVVAIMAYAIVRFVLQQLALV